MKLNNNHKALFTLVSAGLWENCDEFHVSGFKFQGFVDWVEVYHLAEEQSVIGIVLAGIDWFKVHDSRFTIPQEVLLQWIGEMQILEQQNKDMNAFIGRLIEKMRDVGIYTLLLKGQGIAHCYERPLWRASGDVDFLLSSENYNKAKKFLIPLSLATEEEYKHEYHLGMTIDDWVVELHGSLRCGLSRKIDRNLDAIQNNIFCGGNVRSWANGNTQVFLPGINEDVVYVFTHILQHFYRGGIGLRQICDWCRLLWTNKNSLNLGLLESRIRKMGLISEWKAFGAFAVDYLGMPSEAMPFYSDDDKWKKKADKICAFILEVGNMGHKRGSWLMEHDSWLSRQYVVRKAFSMFRRISDLINHARIFPLDSLRFFPRIMFNGVRSAIRGE